MIFVSLDGGATKTIAVAYDDSGRILQIGVNGPSNFRNVGIEAARLNVKSAIDDALRRSGVSWAEVDYFTFAMAGVKDSAKSTEIIDDFISSYKLQGRYSLLNDGEAGFRCRFPDRDGIIAAPGTGMIAYGRKGDRFERCSGWGWFIGDEGGAFYIGRRAIQESAKIADGRTLHSKELLEAVMNEFSVAEPRGLVNEVYSERINVRRIASLARVVSSLASSGDELSAHILEEAASEAARSVISLQNLLGAEGPLPVSGYGGVFRAGKIYWETFVNEITDKIENVEMESPLFGYHAVLGSVQTVLSQNGKNLGMREIDLLARELDQRVTGLPESEKSSYLLM
ncbi:hypothetical protein IX51_09205 [uncultured archaeon]|nr:hypothetical protein IX51_09205 [uncultured archaeon]